MTTAIGELVCEHLSTGLLLTLDPGYYVGFD